MNIIILISTPDARGLVHKISSNLLEFNIEKNDEFVDKESGQFFMRTEISVDSAKSQNLGGNQAKIAESSVDSTNPLPSISLDSFSQKGCTPLPAPPTRQKLRFSLLGGEPRLSASSKKSAGGTSAPFDSDFLHHEAGEIKGASHGFNLDSAELQNLIENKTKIAESSLDSANQNNPSLRANPQDLRGNPPCEKSQNLQRGWLLRDARKSYGLPRSHSFARNDDILDSSLRLRSAQNDNKVDCHADSALDSANAIKNRLHAILPKNSFLKVTPKRKKSLIIFATKESHCLGDLLLKNYNNELNIEIKAVISNHADLGALVGKFHIPYFHISHEREDYENEMLQICANFAPDFIVLAKYMRILRPSFIAHYENRIINIHHSFLPAFIGANPYKQAYNRGVKIIGATAHFVTSELDSGPIICQDILQVNHTFSWQDMQKAGRNIERVVLARAVELAIDERIFIHNNKTIIF